MQITSTPNKLVFLATVRSVAATFQEIVADHPLASRLQENVESTRDAFNELCNKSMALYTDDFIGSGILPQKLSLELPKAKGTEADDEAQEVNDGHYTTMMDRAGCLDLLFNTLVAKHSLAAYVQEEVTKVGDVLADLYQEAARLSLERDEEKDGKG